MITYFSSRNSCIDSSSSLHFMNFLFSRSLLAFTSLIPRILHHRFLIWPKKSRQPYHIFWCKTFTLVIEVVIVWIYCSTIGLAVTTSVNIYTSSLMKRTWLFLSNYIINASPVNYLSKDSVFRLFVCFIFFWFCFCYVLFDFLFLFCFVCVCGEACVCVYVCVCTVSNINLLKAVTLWHVTEKISNPASVTKLHHPSYCTLGNDLSLSECWNNSSQLGSMTK